MSDLIKDLQRRIGVTADGIYGPATHSAVLALISPKDASANHVLSDGPAFFDHIRKPLFPSGMAQPQVDGINALLVAMAGWPIAWVAYGLATAYHETAKTMLPVREAYWLSEAWRKANLRYYPFYGRGYVQLTWRENYERADKELGLGGTLLLDLDRAMEPDIAARIMVFGMEQGWFAGDANGRHTLARHMPNPIATDVQFTSARRIINGIDKAQAIAKIAMDFQNALTAGGWA